MMDTLRIILGICIAPFVIYACVKFGTIGFYKAKQYMEKEKNN